MKNAFRAIGPTTYLCPIPSVMLGCASENHRPNLITIAWTGVVCSKPPMVSVSIQKRRLSHEIISQSGEFTLNLVGRETCEAMDYCGVKSGRDVDKFAQTGLTAIPAPGLSIAPAAAECPAFLSCKVKQVIELGSHDLFLAEVKEVCVQDKYFREDGSIDEGAMELVCYVHGGYRAVSGPIGFFGFSVASPEVRVRRMKEARK